MENLKGPNFLYSIEKFISLELRWESLVLTKAYFARKNIEEKWGGFNVSTVEILVVSLLLLATYLLVVSKWKLFQFLIIRRTYIFIVKYVSGIL